MNKKTLIIATLSIFILTVSAANFAEAQDFQVPTPPPPTPVASNEPAPSANSPRELCQFYDSRWERAIFIGAVGNPTENDCLYKISDGRNIGYIHGYYSGNKFCVNSYGAYFNAGGVPDSTSCKSVPQKISAEQQQKTPSKIATPAKPLKKPKADDSQAFKDLFNLNNLSKMMNDTIDQAAENLRSFFDSLFNDAKKFFRIKT